MNRAATASLHPEMLDGARGRPRFGGLHQSQVLGMAWDGAVAARSPGLSGARPEQSADVRFRQAPATRHS